MIGLLLLCALALAGCGAGEPQVFSTGGFSVELDSRFKEKELEPFDAYYLRRDMSVFAKKEAFADLENGDAMTALEYAEQVLAVNEVDAAIEELDGMPTFVYFKEAARKDFAYYAYVLKGSDGFWLVQFAVPFSEREELEGEIRAFAKTMRVE